MLLRLMAETIAPPSPATRKARSQRAEETCLFLDAQIAALKQRNVRADIAEERAHYLCGYALQLLRGRLEDAAEEVAPHMIRVMGLKSYRESLWDRWYLEDLTQGLTKVGKQASPTGVRAEALRFRLLAGEYKPEEIDAAKQSLATLAQLVPKLDTLEFDLFDIVEGGQGLWGGVKPEGRNNQVSAFLRAWYDLSKRISPQADTSLKIRDIVCQEMMYHNMQRALLKECADALVSAWEQRVETGRPVTFDKEEWLASSIPQMYQSYSYETQDFSGGLDDVRRVRTFIAQRVQNEPNAAALAENTDKIENNLAGQVATVARKK